MSKSPTSALMVKVSYRIRGPMALWQRQNEPLEAAVLDAGMLDPKIVA